MNRLIMLLVFIMILTSCFNNSISNYSQSDDYVLYKEFVFEKDLETKYKILEKIKDDKILALIVKTNVNWKLYPKYFTQEALLKIQSIQVETELLKQLVPLADNSEKIYDYAIIILSKTDDEKIMKKIFMYDYTKQPLRNTSLEHPLLQKFFSYEYRNDLVKADEMIKLACLRSILDKDILSSCLKKYTYYLEKSELKKIENKKESPDLQISHTLTPEQSEKFQKDTDKLLNDTLFSPDLLEKDFGKIILVAAYEFEGLNEFAASLRNDTTIEEYKFLKINLEDEDAKRKHLEILKKIVNKEDFFIRRSATGVNGGKIYSYLIMHNKKAYILTDNLLESSTTNYVKLRPVEILNISENDNNILTDLKDINDCFKRKIVVKYFDTWEKKINFFSLIRS